MQNTTYFDQQLFRFLRGLKRNNNKAWFDQHRDDNQRHVRDPLLRFLQDFQPQFETIAPKYICDPRPTGGSMFRIYRDMRFVDPDEGPYKLHASAHFRHRRGKDVHAPGYYLHLEPNSCFFAGGLWRPPTTVRNRVHAAIAKNPKEWLKIKNSKAFAPYFGAEDGGMLQKPSGAWRDSLPDAVRDDLRRKDFLFSVDLPENVVTSSKFRQEIARITALAAMFMDFISVGVQ